MGRAVCDASTQLAIRFYGRLRTNVLWRIQLVHEESASQLGFEPSRLGRHAQFSVRDAEQLLNARLVDGKGHRRFPLAYSALEFCRPVNAANEIDATIYARIFDAEDRRQDAVLQECHVQGRHRIRRVDGAGINAQLEPVLADEDPEGAGLFRSRRRPVRSDSLDPPHLSQSLDELCFAEAVEIMNGAVVGQNG